MQAFETPTSEALNLMMAENYVPFSNRQAHSAEILVTILKRHSGSVDWVSGGGGFSAFHEQKMNPWFSSLTLNT